MAAVRRIAVLDVGRTHTRLAVLEAANGAVLSVDTWSSAASLAGPYPHLEVERTEARLFESLRALVRKDTPPDAIVPVTHGATAALLDGEALALPVLDYTAPLPSLPVPADAFAETLSPPLPGALNLGSQAPWLEAQHAEAFGRADTLLPYPQYWAWRLSGARAAGVTSLGCHTHLWDPRGAHPSRLATERGWDRLLPPLARADAVVGTLLPHVQEATGLQAPPRSSRGSTTRTPPGGRTDAAGDPLQRRLHRHLDDRDGEPHAPGAPACRTGPGSPTSRSAARPSPRCGSPAGSSARLCSVEPVAWRTRTRRPRSTPTSFRPCARARWRCRPSTPAVDPSAVVVARSRARALGHAASLRSTAPG